MKKTIRKIASFIMAAVLACGISVSAGSFDDLDESTSIAGASSAISRFMVSNKDGAVLLSDALKPVISVASNVNSVAGKKSAGKVTETVYDEPKTGAVAAESILNVRKAPTTLSDAVEFAVRGTDISVLGEAAVGTKLWYKVQVNSSVGYVAGNYIVFGEEADELRRIVKEEMREASAMPDGFDVKAEWIANLEPDVQNRVMKYRDEINYCLSSAYPQQKTEKNYLGMYSIMIYLIENYTGLSELISEYEGTDGLAELNTVIGADLGMIELNRQFLTEDAGQSGEEMIESLADITESERASEAEARRQSEEEESRRRSEEESRWAEEHPATPAPETAPPETPAPETAPPETPAPEPQPEAPTNPVPSNPSGQAIADFALSWIGRINYGWGCDDFRDGGYVDCSHFTYRVFLNFDLVGGYTTSTGQRGWGRGVAMSDIQPGDLVCYPGHVGIYVGGGTIVHAPSPGNKISTANVNCLPIVAIRRLY